MYVLNFQVPSPRRPTLSAPVPDQLKRLRELRQAAVLPVNFNDSEANQGLASTSDSDRGRGLTSTTGDDAFEGTPGRRRPSEPGMKSTSEPKTPGTSITGTAFIDNGVTSSRHPGGAPSLARLRVLENLARLRQLQREGSRILSASMQAYNG